MKSLLIAISVVFCLDAFAADGNISPTVNDASLTEKVKKRLYPGGADEEDLKVLEQLPEAAVKVTPASVQKQILGEVIDNNPEEAPVDGE